MKKIGWLLILIIWVVLAIVGNAQDLEARYYVTSTEPGRKYYDTDKEPGEKCYDTYVETGVALQVNGTGQSTQIRETDLYAQAAVLMDARSGRVLYGKNEEQILAMASTTKIMTCILALENAELTEVAEVSAYASGMPEV